MEGVGGKGLGGLAAKEIEKALASGSKMAGKILTSVFCA